MSQEDTAVSDRVLVAKNNRPASSKAHPIARTIVSCYSVKGTSSGRTYWWSNQYKHSQILDETTKSLSSSSERFLPPSSANFSSARCSPKSRAMRIAWPLGNQPFVLHAANSSIPGISTADKLI